MEQITQRKKILISFDELNYQILNNNLVIRPLNFPLLIASLKLIEHSISVNLCVFIANLKSITQSFLCAAGIGDGVFLVRDSNTSPGDYVHSRTANSHSTINSHS